MLHNKNMKYALFSLLMLLSSVAQSTTWGEVEVNDPILQGEKCLVNEPLSFGTYIFSGPSKYDQVFWPFIDYGGIWFCEKSGFVAFIDDFDDLSLIEIERIKTYLRENPLVDSKITTKIERLEMVYSLRETDSVFKNMLLRVLARWNQNLGNIDKANQYRRDALKAIEASLQSDLNENQRLEYLYVAANYARQFGAVKVSDNYLSELISAIANVKGSKNHAEYFNGIYEETKYIIEGGVLDPNIDGRKSLLVE